MNEVIPSHLADLLLASSPEAGDFAWQQFIAQHSRLIMSVARGHDGDHDAAMDRYTFILEHLRRDDFRKLRSYTDVARCKFTTWLVVVCRRLCIDQHRSVFGRTRSSADVIDLRTRRSLTQSLASSAELEHLLAPDRDRPDMQAERSEVYARLEECVSRLPARDRLLVKLRFDDDLSASEIARLMKFATPFHVYRRLKSVLNDLRVALTLGQAGIPQQNKKVRPLNIK